GDAGERSRWRDGRLQAQEFLALQEYLPRFVNGTATRIRPRDEKAHRDRISASEAVHIGQIQVWKITAQANGVIVVSERGRCSFLQNETRHDGGVEQSPIGELTAGAEQNVDRLFRRSHEGLTWDVQRRLSGRRRDSVEIELALVRPKRVSSGKWLLYHP